MNSTSISRLTKRVFLPNPLEHRPRYLKSFTKITFGRFSRKTKRRPIAVFDIETEDGTLLGKPGGIAFTSDKDFPNIIRFSNDHQNCMIHLLEYFLTKPYRGFVAYAHKGMSFDISHILSSKQVQRWLLKHDFSVHVDVSFAIIRKKKHTWYLGDSLRLIPVKLEKVLESFAPHHTKAPLPTTPFSWSDEGWIRRITEDTLGLYESLKKIESVVADAFRVPISLTMPSTALRAARTMLPTLEVERPCRLALDWIRAGAYSGGRIEVFHQGRIEGDIYCFDINSAYAWAMKGEFPIGKGFFTEREPRFGYYIARCRVTIPENQHIPPILSRLFIHAFAVGQFEAMLTKEEVLFARSCGAIVEFVEGWTWKETLHVFSDFIRKCEHLRKEDYKGPLGQTVKLMQNGLYGILGMNAFRRVQQLAIQHPGRPWVHAFDLGNGHYVDNAYEAITFRESPNQMPHWAAIITARVRVHLSRYLKEFERFGLQPLYAHTDSIWCAAPHGLPEQIKHFISDEYGKLKLERHGTKAIIVCPGEAALLCDDGTWHIASKGWTLKDEEGRDQRPRLFENEEENVSLKQSQVFRAGTAMKRGEPGREVTKVVLSYSSMSNRIAPTKKPGPTIPKKADAFDYGRYWSLRSWRVGKLLAQAPSADEYRIEHPVAREYRLREKKLRASANRRAAQWRRMDREFYEGYEGYLRERDEYAILESTPEQKGGTTDGKAENPED